MGRRALDPIVNALPIIVALTTAALLAIDLVAPGSVTGRPAAIAG